MRYACDMTTKPTADYRIERLQAAVNKRCDGNVSAFGRLLGYKDGAFVRQMLAGTRAISEKTVDAVESLPGLENWFSTKHGKPTQATERETQLHVVERPAPHAEPKANLELLRDVVIGVERGLHKRQITLSPEKKADLVVLIYDHYLRAPSADSGETVERYLRLVS
jgi:hypothetical protein